MKVEDIKFESTFNDWFLDYSSAVIIDRAIPILNDGLKPVQRRILYTMSILDKNLFEKVVKLAGFTLQFHPHGDGSVESALVNIAQKDYLIDKQGAYGNPRCGNYDAAAGRYIEAKLSQFAKDVLFSPKVTKMQPSFDSKSEEPVFLPAKFPIVLIHGAEGIAVALSCKILPHNFVEICDSAVNYLNGKDFSLMPDFPTGGFIDCSNYNDGLRGGKIVCRAKIDIVDAKTLSITEIPYGMSCDSLRDSIVKAVDKGKIRIKHIEDNSAEYPEINLTLYPGEDLHKIINALYAFTDCQVSISCNSTVIKDGKPVFLGVSEILKYSVDKTKEILQQELEFKKAELEKKLHRIILEKMFIENKVYKLLENAATYEEGYAKVKAEMENVNNIHLANIDDYVHAVKDPIIDEDIVYLTDLKFKKLTKFDSDATEKLIKQIEKDIKETTKNIKHIVEYTIKWFETLKSKYSAGRERKSAIVEKFSNVNVTSVVANNAKLYVDYANGFIGYGEQMKKSQDAVLIGNCSDIDDVLCISKNGEFGIVKIADKVFFQKDLLYVGIYKKDIAKNLVFNIVYRDGAGEGARNYVKRCTIEGLTRGKKYNLTKGTEGSEILWLDTKEKSKVYVAIAKPRKGYDIKLLEFKDFVSKGRGAAGNLYYGDRKIFNISTNKKDPNELF